MISSRPHRRKTLEHDPPFFSTLAGVVLLPSAAKAEERVVAIGDLVTKVIYAFGAAERLVAVDSTSLYPTAATEFPSIGYMRWLSAKPILALEPDRILAIADAGPKPGRRHALQPKRAGESLGFPAAMVNRCAAALTARRSSITPGRTGSALHSGQWRLCLTIDEHQPLMLKIHPSISVLLAHVTLRRCLGSVAESHSESLLPKIRWRQKGLAAVRCHAESGDP